MGSKYSVDNRTVGKSSLKRRPKQGDPHRTPPPSPGSVSGSSASGFGKENSGQNQRPPPSPSSNSGPRPPPPQQQQQQPVRKKESKGDDPISNWKLFNDLENREEADVLNLSIFLDALSKYIPGLDAQHKDGDAPESLSLNKTVSEQVMGHIDIADMYVHGKELDEVISLQNAKDMIESCRNGQKIQRPVIVRVVNEAMALFRKQPNLVEFQVAPANHITVIGDLHGQLDDLLLIFRENGLPSNTNPYLFNGDIVDRGDRGIEITIIIYLFKILYPNHVHVNRGNHEELSITQVFGFMKECEQKYDHTIFNLFCESFKYLPLATLIDHRVLVVHGGIGRDLLLLREFNLLDRTGYDLTRYRDKPKNKIDKEPHRKMTIMRDLLWSDPKVTKGWEENKRGAGINYGPDIVQKFMTKNKLSLIVRSHECVPRGFDWPYQEQGMLVTLFSASNYCGKANNLGCFMRIPSDRQAKPAFFQYMASAEARDMGIANLDALFSLIVEHRDDLLDEFRKEDQSESGKLSISTWGSIMEDVLDLSLDWKALQPLLTALDKDGTVPYNDFLARYNAEGALKHSDSGEADDEARLKRRTAFNSLYRHRSRLEALFRVLDHDGNGTITIDELENGIKLLNEHLPPGAKAFQITGSDLMKMMDFSHDGEININEFMEGFRINAKLTAHAKWKRARKKIKVLSAIGALRFMAMQSSEISDSDTAAGSDVVAETATETEEIKVLRRVSSAQAPPPVLTRHGSVQLVGGVASLSEVDVKLDDELETVEDESEDEMEEKPRAPKL
uniref:Serine/threonine-protein phosphatase n=1 Tax=Globisporangium ultimum (strain ATCC 200006 / CBS 805.95 / DAOM BR144) TaxID=431595 RepID=K3X824_GLOUD